MADPTIVIDQMAPGFAYEMGEDWDTLSVERQLQWRVLAYKTYEAHVKNKVDGFRQSIDVIESVQVAPSTPKSWLRGVQEAKNALVWTWEGFADELETRVAVPDVLTEDLESPDPYAHLRAGDLAPEIAFPGSGCGAEHHDNWVCSRPPHPDHWAHYDADPGAFRDEDGEPIEELEGYILATWRNGQRLDSLHPALGHLEDN